jgi:hypothetical protein
MHHSVLFIHLPLAILFNILILTVSHFSSQQYHQADREKLRSSYRREKSNGKMCMSNLTQDIYFAEYLNENVDPLHELHEKLDSYINASFGGNVEGHSGNSMMNLERKVYRFIAKQYPCVKSICEIGFNAGHSTLAWLSSNPNATVTMFDLWQHEYSPKGEEFIRSQTILTPDRMKIIKGSSLDTVKQFHRDNPQFKCNVISIDGGHDYKIAVQDVENMKFLSDPFFNILLIDDTNCESNYCVDTTIQEHLRRGTIEVLEGFSLNNNKRGVSIMTYKRSSVFFR